MWLLIDDTRDLNCEVTARNAKAGKKLLAVGGWECLCLDHDLGEETSGYDIAKWALENDFLPTHVQLVTSNPVGRHNISELLKNAGYYSPNGIDFLLVKEG